MGGNIFVRFLTGHKSNYIYIHLTMWWDHQRDMYVLHKPSECYEQKGPVEYALCTHTLNIVWNTGINNTQKGDYKKGWLYLKSYTEQLNC